MTRLSLLLLPLLAACAGAGTNTDTGHKGKPIDVTVTAPGSATCPQPTPAEAAAAVTATNAARAARGLPPVRDNPMLSTAAARHACDMAKRGRMTHVGTSTKGPAERVKSLGYRPMITAENIAAGPFDLHQALTAWNGSEGHLANILIPQLREVGIGRAGNGRTQFWAAVYAAPR